MSTIIQAPGPEQRTATIAVEDVRAEGKTLHGFAALYGAESRDLGGFTETIERGAFSDVLASSPDVYLTFNHSPDKILARTTSGTLRLRDDERGLAFEADLGDGPTAQDVRDMVKRRDLSGASFRFVVAPDGECWDGERRTLTRIAQLIDLSLATTPAYDGPNVELRTQPTEHNKENPVNVETEQEIEETEERSQDPPARATTGGLRVAEIDQKGESRSVGEIIAAEMRLVRKGESRALTTAASIAPQEIATQLFDRLRAASVVLASGIRTLSTDRKSEVWPAITADATPAWTAEAAAITPSDPTFGTVTATPKKLAALVQMSNEVIDDSDPSVVDVLNGHLMSVLGLKLDAGLLEGAGTTEPLGLKNIVGKQTIAAGANGAQPTLDMIADAIALLEAVNVPLSRMRIIVHPRNAAGFRKLKASTAGTYLWDTDPSSASPGGVFGVPVFSSAQLATNETQGTSGAVANSIYVYDTEAVVYVQRQPIEIELNRSRLFNSDQSELRAKLRGDLIAPQPTAIVRITGALA